MKSANAHSNSILVVEDELGISKVCTGTLNAEGFEVEVAVNGKAALDVLSELPPSKLGGILGVIEHA